MNFDDIFDQAAEKAKATTVEETVSAYFGNGCGWKDGRRFRLREKRFAPAPEQRVRAIEACRKCCKLNLELHRTLPSHSLLRERVRQEVGVGPLTWLWIIAMVAQLLAALKQLLKNPAGREASSV